MSAKEPRVDYENIVGHFKIQTIVYGHYVHKPDNYITILTDIEDPEAYINIKSPNLIEANYKHKLLVRAISLLNDPSITQKALQHSNAHIEMDSLFNDSET